ncbi:tetratricopeptide repeat protein [bacterium]|nr:tetratricopeptide repeat protein [bacterium]
MEIGAINSMLGDFNLSFEYYHQALELAEQRGDLYLEIRALTAIGSITEKLGEPQKALKYYNQALELNKSVGNRSQQIGILASIGTIYWTLHDVDKALEYYRQALDMSREIGDKRQEAMALTNIALALIFKGEYEDAISTAKTALEINRNINNVMNEGDILTIIAYAYLNNKDYETSLQYWRDAKQIVEKLRKGLFMRVTYGNMGDVFNKMGEYDSAYVYYNEAIKTGESTRNKLVSSEHKTGYFITIEDLYVQALSNCMQLYRQTDDNTYIHEAFSYLESSRSRVLLDQLAEAKSEMKQGIPPETRNLEESYMEQIEQLSSGLTQLISSGEPDPDQVRQIEDELLEQETNLERLHV